MSPYAAVFVFAVGVFLSNFVWNTLAMKKPFVGTPVGFGSYFQGDFRTHLTGILGGVIWGLGMSLSLIASGPAGFAISYGLGQGATMVAAFWGVFIWKEFATRPGRHLEAAHGHVRLLPWRASRSLCWRGSRADATKRCLRSMTLRVDSAFDVSERRPDLPVVAPGGERQELVHLQGPALVANSGVTLNVDWVDSVRINTSAVERRAATLTTRRTVKKDWQVAWLLRAITCMDLTTLSGDDTDERVRRLCAKAMRPVSESVKADLGIEELRIQVAAVCVYHLFIETARRALEGTPDPRRGGFRRLSGRAQPIPGATRRGAAFGRGGRG